MRDQKIATKLLRLAKQLVGAKFRVLVDRAPNRQDQSDVYRSMRSLVKGDGLWRSEKQGKYILGQIRRYGETDSGIYDVKMAHQHAPPGTLGAVTVEMHYSPGSGSFGKKARRLNYIYWVDTHGVIQEAKIQFRYVDEDGWSAPKGIKVTWKRPVSLQFEEEESEDEAWFKKNRKDVQRVLDALRDDEYWGSRLDDLRDGYKPSDKLWAMLLDETDRLERAEGAEEFPRNDVKTEIVIKVKRAKEDSRESMYGVSYFTVLMGEVEGYKEFGYIRVGDATMGKFLDKTNQDVDDLAGQRLVLRGTFKSNGKMIFGSRVTIRGKA